jgi:glyoxylase-like metal-dependent hydrolase (beta-lactamase superfamily II)
MAHPHSIQAPPLNIPPSPHRVHVQLIDTTSQINGVAIAPFFEPPIKGHDVLNCPAFAFLITHPTLKRSLLFDLGVRKDFDNLAPKVAGALKHYGWDIKVEKDVKEILEENGVDLKGIEGVIWSHWHWDHTGDPSMFPESTALIVGPGVKEAFVPGWPANPDGVIRESDYAGRELREVSFTEGKVVKIGDFRALDYFEDGSFYILDAPGHAIGHLCALARVKGEDGKEGFVFMGGDACHHNGEFRPSQYRPLPESISPHPWEGKGAICPGSIFQTVLRDGKLISELHNSPNEDG